MAVTDADSSETKVDPELLRQLDAADAAGTPVEAVFVLDPGTGAPTSPERVEELTRGLVERAQEESGTEIEDINVFRHLASFVARAEPRLIRRLVEAPEIASATANNQPDTS
jgi:hypothetical protein